MTAFPKTSRAACEVWQPLMSRRATRPDHGPIGLQEN